MGEFTDLSVDHDDVVLAGSMWHPEGEPKSVVIMHPGSGPADRHNDVYFPPIRSMLLMAGHAVASFDKRGVGASTGSLRTTSIEQQAGDLLACAATVRARLPGIRVGAFGHSQGGWVVYEAAARGGLDFIVSNSGPGISPAAQERFALGRALADDPRLSDALSAFDRLVDHIRRRSPLDVVRGGITERPRAAVAEHMDDPGEWSDDEWELTALLFGYEPAPALQRIAVPLLALFGADDALVPVDESVAALHRHVDPDMLTVAVLEGADHRLLRGGELVCGYAEHLLGFMAEVD